MVCRREEASGRTITHILKKLTPFAGKMNTD
jgi:hypothetical protein